MITSERYAQRMAELSQQFHLHRRCHSWHSASYRIKQMAKLHAEFEGKTYEESLAYMQRLHKFDKLT